MVPYVRLTDSLKISSEKEVIKFLFLGYINENKGIWLLLDVVNSLREYLSGKAVFILGGNGEISALKNTIHQKKLEQLVDYVGWVDNDLKDFCLRDADVFILPSYIEALPIALLEAMSYGLPIITTKVGSIPEIIKNDKNGILIEPGNKSELEKAILFSVKNLDKMMIFGQTNYELAKEFNPEVITSKLLSIYKSLMNS